MRDRPLVDIEVQLPPEAVMDRFRSCLQGGQCTCEGHVGRKELSLVLRGEERHVFSPWLSLEAHEWRGGTRLRGRFGPHPNLWTLFVFVYSTWVAVFIGGAVFGYVQFAMGTNPWGLWVAVAAGAAQAVACAVDLYGRAKGAGQMSILRSFVSATLPEAEPVPPDAPLPHEQALA
jgi:hypothetical protein